MGILTLNDIDIFWDLPSDCLMDLYSKAKLKYCLAINEQNIAVAKMNTNLQLFFNSFGGSKSKPDVERIFKESLPFNPDQLKVDKIDAETKNIFDYYRSVRIIPQRVLNTILQDEDYGFLLQY